MKKALVVLTLITTAVSLSGCIVAPYPGYYGYGYGRGCGWHRCW